MGGGETVSTTYNYHVTAVLLRFEFMGENQAAQARRANARNIVIPHRYLVASLDWSAGRNFESINNLF